MGFEESGREGERLPSGSKQMSKRMTKNKTNRKLFSSAW